MYSKTITTTLEGLTGFLVEVESNISRGLPNFNIIGLPDASIKEAKDRVRSCINFCGLKMPVGRITINLAPANIRKEGSQIDLAIALSLLKSMGEVMGDRSSEYAAIGELSLDARVIGVVGALPMVISLREKHVKKVIIPYDNLEECSLIEDIDLIPVRTLMDAVKYINGNIKKEDLLKNIEEKEDDLKTNDFKTEKIGFFSRSSNKNTENKADTLDFSDIKGQEFLKRALMISAAGGHNILMVGSPGSGKTMSAERYPTILPDLTYEESIECSKIYSVKGDLLKEKLISKRPFRSPHHSATYTSIIGGGSKPLPGEISLAHNGVLFLDEIAEFSQKAIEQLREPLENGHLTLSRAKMSVDYPADFILIAAMNPCPCGYYMDPNKECTCSQNQIDRYLSKISNPILDRIDMHVEVYPARYEDLVEKRESMSSAEMKDRVLGARKVQEMRQGKILNAKLGGKNLKEFCRLSEESEAFLEGVYRKFSLSARAYTKILKVARTIADIEGRKDISREDLLEAIQYRKKFQEK